MIITRNRDLAVSLKDEGGLSRQFVKELFSELSRKMQFQKSENELYKPKLQEDNQGNFQPLSEGAKRTYQEWGQLMMFCLNADEEYPIGMLLDQGLFTGIIKMKNVDLQRDFDSLNINDPAVFDTLFSIYQDIHRYNESDVRMVKLLESYSALTDRTSDDLLTEVYSLVEDQQDIKKLNINNKVDNIKKNLPQIKTAIRQYISENYLRPNLAPLHAIARGMQSSPFNYKFSFKDVQRMSPVELSQRLQGRVTRAYLLSKLRFSGTPLLIQTGLKNWIQAADDKKIQLFVFAVTGSSALGSEAEIKIQKGDSLHFRTCFNAMDLDYDNIKEEKDLIERLEIALVAVKANAGFDMA